MGKTGLIVEGGGMRCAYGAGVLDAFLDNSITFDYCIGVSAGSANAASYAAGQRGRNVRFYTQHMHDPNYFGVKSFLTKGELFGLHYIYGDLTNSDGKDPIDYDAIMANPAEFKIVATNARTGKPVYFDKTDMIRDDYRHIMASCSLPAACRPIEIDGEFYYDGGVSDSIPIQRALDDGCEKIVVLLSKHRSYVRKPQNMKIFYKTMCRKYPEVIKQLDMRHITYKKQQEQLFALEKEGKAFIFAPAENPRSTTYTMDEKIEQALYDEGYSDFDERKDDFLRFMGIYDKES